MTVLSTNISLSQLLNDERNKVVDQIISKHHKLRSSNLLDIHIEVDDFVNCMLLACYISRVDKSALHSTNDFNMFRTMTELLFTWMEFSRYNPITIRSGS